MQLQYLFRKYGGISAEQSFQSSNTRGINTEIILVQSDKIILVQTASDSQIYKCTNVYNKRNQRDYEH